MLHRKNRKILYLFIVLLLALCLFLIAKGVRLQKQVIPIIVSPENELKAFRSLSPERKERMEQITQLDSRFTKVYQNDSGEVEVWIYRDENDDIDGAVDACYGIAVVQNQRSYLFPEVYYGKLYQAYIDEEEGNLYFAGDDVSGTEILRQRLYVFELREEDVKLITEISPLDVTSELVGKIIAYGNKKTHTVSLYDFGTKIFTSNAIDRYDEIEGINYEMQIQYVFDTRVKVKIHPGLKFKDKSMYSFEEIEPIEYRLIINGSGDTRPIALIREADERIR
ncbi:MAG: hypothetical protein IJ711_05300 [Lachnospiraceae bacterium]|nr:hypothetical protein [Lachnospiraceae bacterium]